MITDKITSEHTRFYNIIRFARDGEIDFYSLCNKMGKEYHDLRYISNEPAYRQFYQLKEAINNSSEFEKIIVIEKGYKYRLGTKEECKDYVKRLWEQAQDYTQRALAVARKMNRDGQVELFHRTDLSPLEDGETSIKETYASEKYASIIKNAYN